MDNKYMNYMQEHLQNSLEYGQNLFTTAKSAGSEAMSKMSEHVANNIEQCKTFLNCKSFEDVVNWGEKAVKANVDHCINVGSEVYHKVCNEVTEANSDIAKKTVQCAANIKEKFNK